MITEQMLTGRIAPTEPIYSAFCANEQLIRDLSSTSSLK